MARRMYRRSYGGRRSYRSKKSSMGVSTPFILGAALGWLDYDQKMNIPAGATLVAATVPMRGLGSVKQVAQGVVFANAIQSLTGKSASGSSFGV